MFAKLARFANDLCSGVLVRHSLADVPKLLTSSVGRRRIYEAGARRGWLLLGRLAALHRQSVGRRARVVAVVGSFGKTTTSVAIGAALRVPVLWNVLHTRYRIAPAVLAIRPWQKHAVVEIGIGAKGSISRNARIVRPDIVVFTCIGSEHNRSFGSLDHIRDAKARVLEGLRPGGLVVLNGDDERLRAIAAMTSARVITYGFGDHDVRATSVEALWPEGMRIEVSAGRENAALTVKLHGRVMVYPVLAAIAVAMAEGLTVHEAVQRLERLSPLPGRLQRVPLANGATLIRDELKSTIETIDAALDALAAMPGRKIIALGEISEPPGNQGVLYRRLGERLGQIGWRVVVVGQKKAFHSYRRGAKSVGADTVFIHAQTVHDAIRAIDKDLREGDVVLVKGRDTQRLDRIALALQGVKVGCTLSFCQELSTRCEGCRRLATG